MLAFLRSLLRAEATSTRSPRVARRRRAPLDLEPLESREVPAVLNKLCLDFGPAGAPVEKGYTMGAVFYKSTQGYGWTPSNNISLVDRKVGTRLTRDFLQGTDEAFRANMRNGWYRVTVFFGDAARARDAVSLWAEGDAAATIPATAAAEWQTSTFYVRLRDGVLNLRVATQGDSFAINGLKIASVKSPPLTTAPPAIAAAFANGGAVNERTSGAVSFSNVSGGSGGYVYSFDFNNDGVFEVANSASASANVPASYLDDGAGSRTVRGRITDSAGVFSDYTTVISITNVAPSVVLPNRTGSAGVALTFSAGVTDPSTADTNAGFTYSWNFGDGTSSTQAAPSHTYATIGAYTVSVTVKDKNGGQTSKTATATISTPAPVGEIIDTGHDKIPNFGANPNIITVASGNWSSPSTWSLNRVPAAGDIVSILPTFTVTYDVTSDAAIKTVAIQPGGKLIFRTDVNTRLTVVNFLVLEGGELRIGTETTPVATNVKAEVIFADVAIDTTKDPSQYGNGLIALGKVTMHGAVKSDTFVRLAAEPKAGDTTLTLATPVAGWRVGDRIVLPDTRHLIGSERWSQYTKQWEILTIQSISSDNRVLTLSSPLGFDHPGARRADGTLEFLAHVGNLTRNVVVKSQSATGTRGHVMFTQRAEVDIRYAQFAGLGRTTDEDFDDTTYDSAGNVTHVGANQRGRYSVYFSHLMGPTSTPQNGYQYTFTGNAVMCPLDPMPFRWGITVNDSHYGLISDNVLYNWAGAGIVTEAGNESHNVFQRNFVVATRGDHNPRSNDGLDGSAFWLNGFNNRLLDNVAADSVGAHQGIVAGSGFNLFAPAAGSANYRVPLFPGADLQVSGQYQLVDINLTPILEFANNEVYGATATGLTMWHLGTDGYTASNIAESVIKDFRAWHIWEEAFFGYPVQNLTFDGFVVRGHTRALNEFDGGTGWTSGDYWAGNITLRNADIQGMYWAGVGGSTNTPGTFRIENSYFRNYKANIVIQTLATPGSRAEKLARQTIIDNVRFDPHPGAPAFQNIVMSFSATTASSNFIQKDEVFVYDYNGVAGDDFQVYYVEQRADFIVPQTTYYGVDNNNDGIGDWIDNLGAPVAGLTNQQAWDLFGIAIAGAVAPTSATRSGIVGYLRAI